MGDYKQIHISTLLKYYKRPEIQQALVDAADKKEIAVSYGGTGYGKRPDALRYPKDVLEAVKQGATSFHCSEELWNNPLQITTGAKPEDLNAIRTGWDLILDIDTQGTKWVLKEVDQPILIYLLPPSLKILRERLMKRGVDSLEMVKFRLSNARKDMEEASAYHYVIVNDRVEDAVEKLKSIIIAERCRRSKYSIIEENKKLWEDKDG